MLAVPPELIDQTVSIMGRSGITNDQIESEVLAIAGDKIVARRLIDCIEETFGLVLVCHVSSDLVLPTTFLARTAEGEWLSFKWTVEPIFITSFEIAQRVLNNGPREVFQNIAVRSATLRAVNDLLNDGGELEGAVVCSPAMLGIPAEIYPKPKKSLMDRFLASRLGRMKRTKRL